jgi:RNA polymerase sigma factor (sigma-70 family)
LLYTRPCYSQLQTIIFNLTSQYSSQPSSARADIFATTHWTVVLAAGKKTSPEASRALEELCKTYWFPLYAYVRRRGHAKADAEDLTQTFFARLLTKKFLENLDGEKGKFRAFLLAALKHFLANEWDKSQRQKRGGGAQHFSLDWQNADSQFQIATTNEPSPEKNFDREWALALLNKVIARLQKESVDAGRAKQFAEMKIFLTGDKNESSCADAAKNLDMDETAVRVAVHRLRKRYRILLREEISQTLSDPAGLAEEMRALFGAFAE